MKRHLLLLIVASGYLTSYSQSTKTMDKITFDAKGELLIAPSKTSSQNDFDFYVGSWKVHNKKLKSRLSNSTEWIEFDATQEMHKILNGIGNTDNFFASFDGKPFEGMTLRLFNPKTKLWNIYWADSNVGVLDPPVAGSFENNIGTFYTKDVFNGKNIIVKFQWDATNPDKPIWSQAFSPDNGKTWEWNWYMYMERLQGRNETAAGNANHNIKVIELRNYFIKPGRRDEFINYFEENFIQSQNILGGYTLGQYRVKGADDNFFWVRGFKDMPARNKFLNDFYFGPVWQSHRTIPNSLLLNNDNVYLLKPLNLKDSITKADFSFNSSWFGKEKGIAVVDFYTSNTKLDKLIEFVRKQYAAILNASGIDNTSFWTSETSLNEFTRLPVFQDKNLLVQITFYKDELEYQTKMKIAEVKMTEEQKTDWADFVTIKNTLIIYPTEKSFLLPKN
jgi:hypothetical protein